MSLDGGIILGYAVGKWLRLYSPRGLSLYSDGFILEYSLGMSPYIKPLRLGFDLGFTRKYISKYSFDRKVTDPVIYFGVGYGF